MKKTPIFASFMLFEAISAAFFVLPQLRLSGWIALLMLSSLMLIEILGAIGLLISKNWAYPLTYLVFALRLIKLKMGTFWFNFQYGILFNFDLNFPTFNTSLSFNISALFFLMLVLQIQKEKNSASS